MTGSGKTELAKMFEKHDYKCLRFGDITDEILEKEGLPLTEENERKFREEIRVKHGMEAYAKLNIDKIRDHAKIVIDGLRSFEEFKYFKKHFNEEIKLVAIDAPTGVRHRRMAKRKIRPLTEEECKSRDAHELNVLGVREKLAHADLAIDNN